MLVIGIAALFGPILQRKPEQNYFQESVSDITLTSHTTMEVSRLPRMLAGTEFWQT